MNYTEREKKIKAERKVRINYIFDVLEKNGCESVAVEYSGGGDDGQMELSHFVPKDNDKINIALDEPTIFSNSVYDAINGNTSSGDEISLYHLLQEIAEVLLEGLGVDWINGQGSSGNVFFDVKKKNVVVGYQVMEEKEEVFTE